MRKITYDDYLKYVEEHGRVTVEGVDIELKPIEVSRLYPSGEELTDVSTTVWSFPKRGSWATHRGDYRGNWPPQMARALILSYTEPGDTVLDPMVGSGTTCVEAKLLGRNCIGVDINYNAVMLAMHRLYWLEKYIEAMDFDASGSPVDPDAVRRSRIEIYHGDVRDLGAIDSDSIDLIATHPPYFNIIKYSSRESREDGDISRARSIEDYLEMLEDAIGELFRVLKPGRYLGMLVGDTRMHRHYVPITHLVLDLLLLKGFILKEEVVKIQHKMKTTREVWSRYTKRDFLLIYHEKLYILRKPTAADEYSKYRYSSRYILEVLSKVAG